jgi:hypothetical protein
MKMDDFLHHGVEDEFWPPGYEFALNYVTTFHHHELLLANISSTNAVKGCSIRQAETPLSLHRLEGSGVRVSADFV